MAITIIYPDNSTDSSATVSGTSGTRYLISRARDPFKNGGRVRGVYELQSGSGASATYRWVRDEEVDVNTAGTVTSAHAYDIL